MNALTLISPALTLATEIFKFVNEKENRKYIDELIGLQKDLKEEIEKLVSDQNDAKIESLIGEIAILSKAAEAQLRAYGKKD